MLKIAFFTPLHPIKSGIADYAEEMLPYLGKYMNIDIFIDDYEPDEKTTIEMFNIYPFPAYEEKKEIYDVTVYQMGNNQYHKKIYYYTQKYPGVVILHDFAIHHLMANLKLEVEHSWDAYFDEVEFNHGSLAKNKAMLRYSNNELGLWETDALEYPMNKRVLSNAQGAIVFSEYAKNRLDKYRLQVPIERVYLHCGENKVGCTDAEVAKARNKVGFKLENKDVLIGVFGFITEAKRPFSIIQSVKKLHEKGKKIYVAFVGELSDSCKDLRQTIKEYGLSKYILFTGFAEIETFKTYILASDICVSLRHPTMGETSGVFMRALSKGKPSIVSDIGTFSEASSKYAIKITTGKNEISELTAALNRLITEPEYYNKLRNGALKYAEEHLKIEDTAKNIVDFLKKIVWFQKIKKKQYYIDMKHEFLEETINRGKKEQQKKIDYYVKQIIEHERIEEEKNDNN